MPIERPAVLMPTFNSENTVARAVKSILQQTFRDFEMVVYDDGSDDQTLEILHSVHDPRLRIVCGENNIGESDSRNLLLQETKARIVFVMDADDEAHPRRLDLQMRYLRSNETVMVVGTWASTFTPPRCLTPALSDREIRKLLRYKNPILHPTVALNRELVGYDDLYPQGRHPTPDFSLWKRLASERSFEFANIPLPLVRYRMPTAELMRSRQVNQEPFQSVPPGAASGATRGRAGIALVRRFRLSEVASAAKAASVLSKAFWA